MHVSFVMLVRPSILVSSISGSLMHVSFVMLGRPSILVNSFSFIDACQLCYVSSKAMYIGE